MTRESTSQRKSFLDPRCKHFLKEMISSYDVIRKEFFEHLPFLIYWSDCVGTKPSAENALQYAFKYYKKLQNTKLDETIEKIADDYLEEVISYYNSEHPDKSFGKNVAQFIRAFKLGEEQKKERTEIKTDDFEWLPSRLKHNHNFEQISKEFDFAWKTARLWQLLKARGQEQFILRFLGIVDEDEEDEKKELISTSSKDNIPQELSKKLETICFEDVNYLKKNIDFFSPEFMQKHDMCVFFKKACVSSLKQLKNDKVKVFAPSDAIIKPLDSIWLLGRFYGIHPYGLNFIKKDLPARAVKQFVGIEGSPFLDWNEKSIDELINSSSSIRVGNHNYPLAIVLKTIYSNKHLLALLESKSNEIIEGKERNPYKPLYDTIQAQSSKNSIISNIDLSDEKFRQVIKKKPGFFKALIFLGSFPDFIIRYQKELEKNSHLIDDLEDPRIIGTMLISLILSEGLENEKNLFIITTDDFTTWEMFAAAIVLFFWCYNILNKDMKKESKQIEVQT